MMALRFPSLPIATLSLYLLLLSSAFLRRASAGGVAQPYQHQHHDRKLSLVKQQPLVLKYHHGLLLKGNYSLDLVWYGRFSPAQRAIIVDFLRSPSAAPSSAADGKSPSVASWWQTTERYQGGATTLGLGRQTLHEDYRLGKSLTARDILALATPGPHRGAITVVLTAADVAVDGFCMSSCGSHGAAGIPWNKNKRARFVYIWVGNSATQCPGQCAWPFHQPIYGPQSPPLVAPNGDVGADGMVINLATLLAGTVTNPFDGGYFQGPAAAPLEAVSACTGMFGTGAYPGNPGNVLVDPGTGASYNAVGVAGRKYLLPAMWDPKTSQCSTLV